MLGRIETALDKVDIVVTMGHANDKDILKPILTKYFNAVFHFGIFFPLVSIVGVIRLFARALLFCFRSLEHKTREIDGVRIVQVQPQDKVFRVHVGEPSNRSHCRASIPSAVSEQDTPQLPCDHY